MEATVEAPSAQTRKDYTSRPGALSRFFRMSRDGWKSEYKGLKATVKGYKNRLAHMTRSREQWRTVISAETILREEENLQHVIWQLVMATNKVVLLYTIYATRAVSLIEFRAYIAKELLLTATQLP